jgi:hypothetical protein
MSIVDKSFKMAAKANKREKMPVFCHLTYKGVTMTYKHQGAYAQPVYMVTNGKVYEVTSERFDGIATRYVYTYDV